MLTKEQLFSGIKFIAEKQIKNDLKETKQKHNSQPKNYVWGGKGSNLRDFLHFSYEWDGFLRETWHGMDIHALSKELEINGLITRHEGPYRSSPVYYEIN